MFDAIFAILCQALVAFALLRSPVFNHRKFVGIVAHRTCAYDVLSVNYARHGGHKDHRLHYDSSSPSDRDLGSLLFQKNRNHKKKVNATNQKQSDGMMRFIGGIEREL
jgi:hypothetical protein